MRRRLLLVVAGAAALAAPAGTRAADHLDLDASTPLGGALSGWRLAVHVDSGDVYATDEAGEPSPLTRGGYVRIRLVRRAGPVDERHDLIGLPTSDTIAFDGTAGALDVRSELGSSLAIRMTISTAGAATPTNALACAGGAFVSVPVRLAGTFDLATAAGPPPLGSAADRDGRIRTAGLLLPKQARYQAAPRPVAASLAL
jgi:hypothetical protein